jgi:hypothetical protein
MLASCGIFTGFVNVRHKNYLISLIIFSSFLLILLIDLLIELKESCEISKAFSRAFFGLIAPSVIIVRVNSSSSFSIPIIADFTWKLTCPPLTGE